MRAHTHTHNEKHLLNKGGQITRSIGSIPHTSTHTHTHTHTHFVNPKPSTSKTGSKCLEHLYG